MTDYKLEIEELCAEYATWAGNDITTQNFRRLTTALTHLINKARIDEAYNILDECAYKYGHGNRMISPKLIKDRIKELES